MSNVGELATSTTPSGTRVCPGGALAETPAHPAGAIPDDDCQPPSVTGAPTWAIIAALFKSPYWIPAADRENVGNQWVGCMKGQGLDLTLYIDVSTQATVINQAIKSKDMPITSDPTQYFPPAALDLFQQWIDAGFPQ